MHEGHTVKRKNPNVECAGRVGAKLKPKSGKRPFLRGRKVRRHCCGGPFDGQMILLTPHSDYLTLPLKFNGVVGRYRDGLWEVVR